MIDFGLTTVGEDVTRLGSGRPQPPRGTRREANIGAGERAAFALGGGIMAATGIGLALERRSWGGLVLAAAGGVLTYRGLSGHCPVYTALGMHEDDATATANPLTREITVEHAITIQRRPEDLYARWRDLANLPRILRHIQKIEVLDERRSRWTVAGPAHTQLEWEAEITDEQPGKRIAWRAVEQASVPNTGSVRFEPAGADRGTVVRISLTLQPPAGVVGAAIAKLFGRDPAQQVREDLRRFRQLMETGELATSDGPSARRGRPAPPQPVTAPRPVEDPVTEASEQSFPASDPPAFNPGAP